MQSNRYILLKNLKFHILSAKKWNPKLFYFQFLMVLPCVLSGYISALIPSQLVKGLEEKQGLEQLVGTVVGLILVLLICEASHKTMHEYLYRNSMALTLYYDKLCFQKMMSVDYDRLEEPENQKLIGNTWNVLRNEFAIRNSITGIPQLMIAFFASLWYGAILASKSVIIVLCLMISAIVGFFLLNVVRKEHRKKHKEISRYARAAAYVNRQAMERTAGKDIRLYQMQDWLLEKYRFAVKSMDNIYAHIHNWYFFHKLVENIFIYTTYLIAYGYLIYQMTQGKLAVSEFVLFIGLFTEFVGRFGKLIYHTMELNPLNISLTYIRQFLDMEEDRKSGAGIGVERLSELKKQGVKVELRHVSYTYPGKKEPTLFNINLVIQPNEKLALIGLNGAGKTTLVKLLCGFYQPTEGEILINDIPVSEFTREEYSELMSVLFQDSMVFPMSLDTNLTAQPKTQIERERLGKALGLSGFHKRYEALPQKGETLLVRETNEKAADFSGGEKQKLLFARALYKQAPLLILDEPTAALDPIAENELYLKYGEAARNRTSLYISHRLSSTRFCDRIILLEHAQIQEEGTHEELMKKNGRYAELYELQSQYYKDENDKKEVADYEETGLA